MSSDERLLLALLEELERHEARLLTWGLVDGFLSAAEVNAAADRLLDDPELGAGVSFVSSADVLAALRARVLLLDVGETPGSASAVGWRKPSDSCSGFVSCSPSTPA